jgi:hypothetical protein
MQPFRLSALVLLVAFSSLAAPQPLGHVSSSVPDRARQVEVAFVGKVAADASLVALVEELLVARDVTVIRRTPAALVESDLLRQNAQSAPNSARVWITLPDDRVARIWFADPNLERYLWRELHLDNGLDALGREQIAQVVQSSTEALIRGASGLTQTDARRAWQEQQTMDVARQPRPRPRAPRLPERRVAIVRGNVHPVAIPKPPRLWHSYVGAGYGLKWTGGDFGWLHGPALEVGMDRESPLGTLGLHLAAERHFDQTHAGSIASLSLQSTVGWLLLCWRDAISSRYGFVAKAGVGVEFTQITPKAVSNSKFAPSRANTDITTPLRLSIGLDGSFWPVFWEAAGLVELSPQETHYDVTRLGSNASPLSIEPWLLRPGIQLQFAWR